MCRISEGLAGEVLVEDNSVPASLHNHAAEAPEWDSQGLPDHHTPEVSLVAWHIAGKLAVVGVTWKTLTVPRSPSVP